MPNIRGSSYGDLYIELNIETPVNLNEKQKDLLREFEKSLQETANNPKYSNFFSKVKKFLGEKQQLNHCLLIPNCTVLKNKETLNHETDCGANNPCNPAILRY